MPSRCDLHVHSRHSDRPSERYLERIGARETAERRGWDPFVDALYGAAESVAAAAGERA